MSKVVLYSFVFYLIIFSSLSCKTTPIVYDSNIDPRNREIVMINVLIENKKYEEAENKIKEELILYPNNIDFLIQLGWLFLVQKKLSESEIIFKDIIEKQKSVPLAYLGLAKIARFRDDKDNAFYYIDRGLKLSKTIADFYIERGILFYQDEQYSKALKDFNTVLILDYRNIGATLYKYLVLLLQGENIDDIKNYWNKVLESTPLEEYYFLYHAEALERIGKHKLAESILKQGLSFFPDGLYILNSYSYFLYSNYLKSDNEDEKNGFLNDALLYIEKCIKIGEENNLLEPYFLDSYFLILEAKGEQVKIKYNLKKYIYLYPDSVYLIEWAKKYGNNIF